MNRERKTQTVFVQVVEKPRRKLLLKVVKKPQSIFSIARKWGVRYGRC